MGPYPTDSEEWEEEAKEANDANDDVVELELSVGPVVDDCEVERACYQEVQVCLLNEQDQTIPEEEVPRLACVPLENFQLTLKKQCNREQCVKTNLAQKVEKSQPHGHDDVE